MSDTVKERTARPARGRTKGVNTSLTGDVFSSGSSSVTKMTPLNSRDEICQNNHIPFDVSLIVVEKRHSGCHYERPLKRSQVTVC